MKNERRLTMEEEKTQQHKKEAKKTKAKSINWKLEMSFLELKPQ